MPSRNLEYSIDAPQAAVFAAWLSNETVIAPVTCVDIDPVVGGRFHLHVGGAAQMRGTILHLEEGRHVRYSWAWNGGHQSIVDVRFSATGGGTSISIEHNGLADEEDAERHAAGWDSYIVGLRTHV
ncbi:MAG: SRPBCC domain-containing protein [Pseudomonadota bacterium]